MVDQALEFTFRFAGAVNNPLDDGRIFLFGGERIAETLGSQYGHGNDELDHGNIPLPGEDRRPATLFAKQHMLRQMLAEIAFDATRNTTRDFVLMRG